VLALSIVVIGVLSAILAWRFEGAPDEMLQELNEPTKKSLYQLERIGGTSQVIMAEIHDWWLAQWRSPNLPYTILILTIGSAGALMMIAQLDEHGGD
jgi:hypothetical protein